MKKCFIFTMLSFSIFALPVDFYKGKPLFPNNHLLKIMQEEQKKQVRKAGIEKIRKAELKRFIHGVKSFDLQRFF